MKISNLLFISLIFLLFITSCKQLIKTELDENTFESESPIETEPESKINDLSFVILNNVEDKKDFLSSIGIFENTVPFYQYYDNDNLQLELYYDKEKNVGVGIFYDASSMCGFTFEENTELFENPKFSDRTNYYDASNLVDEYTENITYNDKNQITHFYSKGTITGYVDSGLIDAPAVEIEFFYRDDGSLERKKFFYNPLLYGGCTGNSGVCYYDSDERLIYVDSYITHGYIENYYIYEDDEKEPTYNLILDHSCGQTTWANGFIKYIH